MQLNYIAAMQIEYIALRHYNIMCRLSLLRVRVLEMLRLRMVCYN